MDCLYGMGLSDESNTPTLTKLHILTQCIVTPQLGEFILMTFAALSTATLHHRRRSCPNLEPWQLHKPNIEISGLCKGWYFNATSLFSNVSDPIINNFVPLGYQVRMRFNETGHGHGLMLRENDQLFEKPQTFEMFWNSFVREVPKFGENPSDGVRLWQRSLRGSSPVTRESTPVAMTGRFSS